MTKGFFITGTDTGVGKTIISAALVLLLKKMGLKACGMKPVETGCQINADMSASAAGEDLIPSDANFLANITGCNESLDVISPVRFRSPLAPVTAAVMEGRPVDRGRIYRAFAALSEKYDYLIVEGAGGLLVPISTDHFILHLAGEFRLPLLVVARPGLGTINHTLLTVNYALKEGLTVAGVVINYTSVPEDSLAERTNPEVISEFCKAPVIGIFPFLEELTEETITKAAENLDSEALRKFL